MSNQELLAQLKEKRSNLQMFESIQEISVFAGTVMGIFCAGMWLGSFFPKADARQASQLGIGYSMLVAGAAWSMHNLTTKRLDDNWEEMTRVKQEISKENIARTCPNCKYFNKETKAFLGCAVNPSMPPNCSDFEPVNQVEFQDESGLNVSVYNCSEAEVEEIKTLVNQVFNSEALPSP